MKKTEVATTYQAFNHKIEASSKEDLKNKINRIIDALDPFYTSNRISFTGVVTLSKKATEVKD